MDIQIMKLLKLLMSCLWKMFLTLMDEDLFDAGVLDSMGTVELIVEIENRFDIRVPVTEFGRDDWNTANKIIAGIVELQNA